MHRLALIALILPLVALSLSGCKEEAGKTIEVKIQGAIPIHAVVNVAENFSASVNYKDASTTASLLSYRWDVLSGPTGSGAVIMQTAAGQVTVIAQGVQTLMTFTIPGTYVIRCTVFETSGTVSDSDTASWVVASSAGG